jgi:hypothetical protein
MARKHGPKCIAVLAEMLDDPDRKVRGFAAQALLDRGYGRPNQAVAVKPEGGDITAWHLIAASSFRPGRVIDGPAGDASDKPRCVIDLTVQPTE